MEPQDKSEPSGGMAAGAQELAATARSTVREATVTVSGGVGSLAELVRRYPVPAVVVGAGLGYLLAPTVEYGGRRGLAAGRTLGSTLGDVGGPVQEAAQDPTRRVAEAASGLPDQAQDVAAAAARRAREATAMVGQGTGLVGDLGRRYPLPAILLGLGVGCWLATSARR
jgi:hypothetical protein